MVWKQRSAEELVKDAETRKEGKIAPGFKVETRYCEVGDLITLLIAGGELKAHNSDFLGSGYSHKVQYSGYLFLTQTGLPLPDGILNRDYSQ